jgi:uncharacterized membrane protein (UPF0127 family)
LENIKIGFGSKKGGKINIEVKRVSIIGATIGLMFKTRKTKNLLFDFPGRWGLHSWFVFFDFLAVWLDEKNNIIEYRRVKPFTYFVKPKTKFAKLVEIPVTDGNKRILNYFPSIRGKI